MLFPHATPFFWQGAQVMALPHGLNETRMLRNFGFEAPAPVAEHYHYPSRDQRPPFEVQVKTCSLATMCNRAYILNKMGTGKTRSALWSYDYLRQTGHARRALIVAPLSTLRVVWQKEILSTLSHARVEVLVGTRDQRLKKLANPDAELFIVNHDGLEIIESALAKMPDIDTFILDEISAYRNARAQRSKVAQRLSLTRPWVWGLTGSPTPKAPTDAYGLAKLITPQSAPRSFTKFRQETMLEFGPFTWKPRKDAAEIVAGVLQPSVCYSLDDVVELPDLIMRPYDVQQGTRQQKIYKELLDHASALLKSGQVTAANGGVLVSKLLQTSCGYLYKDDHSAETLDNDDRMDAMLDIIDGSDRKIIVFSPFIAGVKGIADRLAKEGEDFAVVTGATPQGERNDIFRLFQDTNRYRVLVAHPQCMAHGLTLTAADTIIWFSPTTSLEIFEQANARITRVGQGFKQQIFMLQGTTAEKRRYAALRDRSNEQNSVLDELALLTE